MLAFTTSLFPPLTSFHTFTNTFTTPLIPNPEKSTHLRRSSKKPFPPTCITPTPTPTPNNPQPSPTPPLDPSLTTTLPPHIISRLQTLHSQPSSTTTNNPQTTPNNSPSPTSALQFFRLREGTWESRRTTHHLAFRRAESGESCIKMRYLSRGDDKLNKLMSMHGMEGEDCWGGCEVSWKATLAWDNEGENHEGDCVFGLVPEEGWVGGGGGGEGEVVWGAEKGRLFRDRGYAEGVPVVGRFWMEEGRLRMETGYEGGMVEETFGYEGLGWIVRSSVVRRFGGLASSTFAVERRVGGEGERVVGKGTKEEEEEEGLWGLVTLDDGREIKVVKNFGQYVLAGKEIRGPAADLVEGPDGELYPRYLFSFDQSFLTFGDWSGTGEEEVKVKEEGRFGGRFDFGGENGSVGKSQGKMPAGSAFGSGFSTNSAFGDGSSESKNGNGNGGSKADKSGVDLSKVPPSMRADFEKSLELDRELERKRAAQDSQQK